MHQKRPLLVHTVHGPITGCVQGIHLRGRASSHVARHDGATKQTWGLAWGTDVRRETCTASCRNTRPAGEPVARADVGERAQLLSAMAAAVESFAAAMKRGGEICTHFRQVVNLSLLKASNLRNAQLGAPQYHCQTGQHIRILPISPMLLVFRDASVRFA